MTDKSDHKFPKGVSGNPTGRPRGAKSKSTQLIERLVSGPIQDVKDILAVTVAEAKKGESWAVREILARLWPIPRDRATVFELREIRLVGNHSKGLPAKNASKTGATNGPSSTYGRSGAVADRWPSAATGKTHQAPIVEVP
jgi:hypothetical protein